MITKYSAEDQQRFFMVVFNGNKRNGRYWLEHPAGSRSNSYLDDLITTDEIADLERQAAPYKNP